MPSAGVEEDVAQVGAHDAYARIAALMLLAVENGAVAVARVVDGLEAIIREANLAKAVIDAEELVEHAKGVGCGRKPDPSERRHARARVMEPPCSVVRARVSTIVLRMP